MSCNGAVVAIGWFVIPPLIESFFPKYTESIEPAQLLLLSGLYRYQRGNRRLASLKDWWALGTYAV